MKGMIWHPEEKDRQVDRYLEQTNHAPYGLIVLLLLGGICLFTFLALVTVV